MSIINKIDTTDIFLKKALYSEGNYLLISKETGNCIEVDSGLSLRGFDGYFVYGKAEGDFSESDWGISQNEGTGKYEVHGEDGEFIGSCDAATDALRLAVNTWGLPAENHDEINEEVAKAQKEEAQGVEC